MSLHALSGPRNAARERSALVDAAALAVELGVTRGYVYEHADELGALRLGSGPRARLRFDPDAARAALACYGSERSQPDDSASTVPIRAALRASNRPSADSLAARRPKPGSILRLRPRQTAGGR